MRPSHLLFAFALLVVGAAPAAAQAPKPGTVAFRGKSYEAAALPAEASPAARAAVAAWSAWAKSRGYRMDLDPSQRVLLVHARASADAPLALVQRTLAHFDSLFPPLLMPTGPETADAEGEDAKAGAKGAGQPGAKPDGKRPGDGDPDVIPEDPEGPPLGAPKTLPPGRDDAAAESEALRREIAFRPDSETAVMLVLRNSEDYAAALEELARVHPYLATWKAKAATQIGFVLGTPLCGAYNENSPGQEEWNPDNELVHRTMTLLVLRRFSAQPYWLQTGLAWHAEMAIQKSIYCMPYRDGFVAIGEHGGWIQELGSIYKGREKQPLSVQEFALRRGVWDDRGSKTALGMVDYLAAANARALSALMGELRRYAERDNKRTNADGTWQRDADYEVPLTAQRALLERYFGERLFRDVIARWTAAPK